MLSKYDTEFEKLPEEIQLTIKHNILYPEELEAYLTISKKWYAKAPIIRKAFYGTKFYRKFVNDPKLLKEFYSNVISGGLSTSLAHKAGLLANPGVNAPVYTIDMLAGLILDTEVTLLTSKAPRYYKELLSRGIVEPSKISKAKSSIQTGFKNTFKKTGTKLNKHLKKMLPFIDKSTEKIVSAGVKTGQIPKKFAKEAKKHIKNMLTLSTYFGMGGFITAHAYMGVQKLMYRFGHELADPYMGFSAMNEVEHWMLFSLSTYTRMLLTKKVASKTEGFLNRVIRLDKSKTLKKMSYKLTKDEEKFAKGITSTVVFSSVFGIYFMNNLWGATLFMKYRENDFDPSYLYNPYQDEIKEYWKEMKNYFEKDEELKKDLEEVQQEVNNEGTVICNDGDACTPPVEPKKE